MSPPLSQNSIIITLNIGGQIFQTTQQTLSLTSPTSPLSSLSPSSSSPPFFDRDPTLFSHLLAFLRSNIPPPPHLLPHVLLEAEFFSLPDHLVTKLSVPVQFDPFCLSPSLCLTLSGRDPISAVSVSISDELPVLGAAHGGKVSTFSPSLLYKSTVLTEFLFVDSILPLSPSVGAIGAKDFAGLHLIDLKKTSSLIKILHWAPHPSQLNSSSVLSIGSSPDLLFSSFESSRRNSSTILAFDLEKFEPVLEIARKEIFGAEIDSAIPATKLQWINNLGLLMAAGSHSGPAGLSGYINFWDPRSNKLIYDLKEKDSDCFADVTISDQLLSLFKIGVNSGDLYMRDLRKIESMENWVCLGEGRGIGRGNLRKKEGLECKIASYEKNVFVARGGEVEMWSEAVMGEGEERVMKRNLMGREKDRREKKKIDCIAFGGNRMVLSRKDEMCLEVWESLVK
ncbi:hypothetical protein LUZ60_002373 [Juncus effusus]|nr:hypothetical protein LUZ60_002373 [Juncus effusus]